MMPHGIINYDLTEAVRHLPKWGFAKYHKVMQFDWPRRGATQRLRLVCFGKDDAPVKYLDLFIKYPPHRIAARDLTFKLKEIMRALARLDADGAPFN